MHCIHESLSNYTHYLKREEADSVLIALFFFFFFGCADMISQAWSKHNLAKKNINLNHSHVPLFSDLKLTWRVLLRYGFTTALGINAKF